MNKYLFIVIDQDVSDTVLTEALQLTKRQNTVVDILFLSAPVPKKYEHLKDDFISHHKEKLLKTIKNNTNNASSSIYGEFFVKVGKPFIKLIEEFLNENSNYSMIIKQMDRLQNKGKGYAPIDVSLIRKSPLPVLFLNEEIEYSDDVNKTVYVAIDPDTETKGLADLNIKLLEQADNLALANNSKLNIISCWHVEHEVFLRNSAFSNLPDESVDKIEQDTKEEHCKHLENLIEKVHLQSPYEIICKKGKADKIIPEQVNENENACLVMGTTGRSGLSGFLIGNTAENILRQIDCSLLTICPQKA
jgi:nucleotide-binding universal stress UspA family protein